MGKSPKKHAHTRYSEPRTSINKKRGDRGGRQDTGGTVEWARDEKRGAMIIPKGRFTNESAPRGLDPRITVPSSVPHTSEPRAVESSHPHRRAMRGNLGQDISSTDQGL